MRFWPRVFMEEGKWRWSYDPSDTKGDFAGVNTLGIAALQWCRDRNEKEGRA